MKDAKEKYFNASAKEHSWNTLGVNNGTKKMLLDIDGNLSIKKI